VQTIFSLTTLFKYLFASKIFGRQQKFYEKKGDNMAVAVNYKEKLKNKDLDSFLRNADDQNAEEAMS
jgi:hypothetical protein